MKIAESRTVLWALLAAPSALMLFQFLQGPGRLGPVLQGSGEWSVRFLVLALAATPIRMIFRGQRWPMWLLARRGDIGMAAFLYACLHLAVYIYREGYIANVTADLVLTPILMGWAAFLAMAVPFFTSGRAMARRLGRAWKPLQRLAYAAAVFAFVHWLQIRVTDTPAYVHLVPLAVLEAYRLIWRIMRPWRHPSG